MIHCPQHPLSLSFRVCLSVSLSVCVSLRLSDVSLSVCLSVSPSLPPSLPLLQTQLWRSAASILSAFHSSACFRSVSACEAMRSDSRGSAPHFRPAGRAHQNKAHALVLVVVSCSSMEFASVCMRFRTKFLSMSL